MWQPFGRFKRDECSRTRELLSGYLDHRLEPEDLALVEEHLGACPGCREELESLRAVVAVLHRLPEVTPSRSFAVVPARPLPGRRALPALRFATAGVVLLLVLAFAVDQTSLFERKGDTLSFSAADSLSEGDEAYWTVRGSMNSVDTQSEAPVDLVVPDNTDNVNVAVDSLATDGVLYANVASNASEVPQVVLEKDEQEAAARGEAEEFAVLSGAAYAESGFALNGIVATSEFSSIIEEQDGRFLNIVPAVSDNNVMYSFDLDEAQQREVRTAREDAWLRPLEYGLIGLTAVLGAATFALWLRQRRARAVEADKGQE